jgi:D-ornithine---citrate ligase
MPIFAQSRSSQTVFPAVLATDAALRQARERGLIRMLQALFREDLLPAAQLITEGAVSWLPLWSAQALLRFDGLQIGRAGHCRLAGSITYYHNGQRGEAILTAAMLLHRIAKSLPIAAADPVAAGDDLRRLAAELDNSLDNDILCLSYRQTWAQRLNHMFPAGAGGFMTALRNAGLANPALLLEQWGTLGHPWHPNYKTKMGLDAADVIALSPEFEAQLQVPVVAVRAACMHVEIDSASGSYRAWFARTFPQAWRQWEAALSMLAADPADWLPLPVHPYQAQRVLPVEFAAEIAAGQLLLLADVTLAATPTMSFRTVAPVVPVVAEGAPTLPHIKLPVGLRLTSVQRTVSPKSAVMGPRLTILLKGIIANEGGFSGALDILAEDVSLHYLDPQGNDDHARHLAALYRANPMSKRTEALFPVPVAALFSESPHDGRPLVTELVRQCDGDHAAGAVVYFERYCATVLRATLSAYLLYGIAFEAHQQNSFIMLSPGSAPMQLLLRDFGDLRIHAPTLQHSGLALALHRPGFTLFDSDEPVRDKLLHAVMLCHLGELAQLLAGAYHCADGLFWDVLRVQIALAFDGLRARTDPARWAAERAAILSADWPAKAFLRMRLSDSSDDVHGTMPNPVRADPA